MRAFVLAVLGVLAFAHAGAAESLEGTWRQQTPNLGQSDWVLIDAGKGFFRAQEIGLGQAQGVARFRDGTLTINWKTADGGSGVWEWKLNGKTGTGAMFCPDTGEDIPNTVQREYNGHKVRAFEGSRIRQLSPPASLVEVWKQNTPGVGESLWTLVNTGSQTFRAAETGLGEMRGTARHKDGVLKVEWKTDNEEAFYEWKLDGRTGTGSLVYVRGGPDLPGGATQERDGKKVRAFPSTVSRVEVHTDPRTPARFALPVKLVGQQHQLWCFAAATQMVLAYNRTGVSQGELLNVFTHRTDCAQLPIPEPCQIGGGELPLLEHFHYSWEFRHGPLTPEELVREIHTRRKPFIFGWDGKKGGGHSLVAIGYVKLKGSLLVDVLDPSPIGEGSRYFCTYQRWLEDDEHTYQDSIFNISRPKSLAPKKE